MFEKLAPESHLGVREMVHHATGRAYDHMRPPPKCDGLQHDKAKRTSELQSKPLLCSILGQQHSAAA